MIDRTVHQDVPKRETVANAGKNSQASAVDGSTHIPSKHTPNACPEKERIAVHFSLPSDSLIRLKLASRTDSMSSDLSAGSAIPSTSFIHSMEMLREMISKANTSGNHYNISVDELRMLQSSLIEAEVVKTIPIRSKMPGRDP